MQVKLIEAFLELASEIGVANITLQKVSARAKVAFGTVRYHFASPEGMDLTQAAVFYSFQKGYQHIEEFIFKEKMKPQFNGIISYVRANFDWLSKNRMQANFLIYYYYLCSLKTKPTISNEQFLLRARTRIKSLLHEAIGQGIYSPLQNIDEVVLKIHALVLGGAVVGLIDPSKDGFSKQQGAAISGVTYLIQDSLKAKRRS